MYPVDVYVTLNLLVESSGDDTMIKPIRLIASDLDGTLFYDLNKHSSVSNVICDENLQAIRQWLQEGNHFVYATGRRTSSRQRLNNKYDLNCDVIACNGAKAIVDDQVLWDDQVEPELLVRLLKLLKPYRNELDYVYDMDMKERITLNQHHLFEEMYPDEFYDRTSEIYLQSPQEMYPNKVFILMENEKRTAFFLDLLNREFSGELYITSSGPRFIECCPVHVSKSNALHSLIEHFSLEQDQVAAIGDELNDMDMLHSIPYGVIMNSARAELKEQIPYSVDSVAELIHLCLDYNHGITRQLFPGKNESKK